MSRIHTCTYFSRFIQDGVAETPHLRRGMSILLRDIKWLRYIQTWHVVSLSLSDYCLRYDYTRNTFIPEGVAGIPFFYLGGNALRTFSYSFWGQTAGGVWGLHPLKPPGIPSRCWLTSTNKAAHSPLPREQGYPRCFSEPFTLTKINKVSRVLSGTK
jgi:hypothetical protein